MTRLEKNRRNDRARNFFAGFVFLFPLVFVVWAVGVMFGVNMLSVFGDSYTQTDIIFRALPQGFLMACGFSILFNIHD